jgi:H+/gluconate symporter-like permease
VPAVVLAGAFVTYGGVSLFVAFFVLAPMAQELFRAAGIPRRLMPAAIVLGTSTFTMSALPGTPSIQNAIPMPFFGTTPFAAPGLGILASLIMLGFGLWWLNREEAIAKRNGESFGDGAPMPAERLATDEKLRERATSARVRSGRDHARRGDRRAASGHACRAAPRRGDCRQSRDVIVHPSGARYSLSRRSPLG